MGSEPLLTNFTKMEVPQRITFIGFDKEHDTSCVMMITPDISGHMTYISKPDISVSAGLRHVFAMESGAENL